ncbi:hypothetical protein BC835DRAFT_60146 [Cytidiella melzeri]|nr:hypothetical protein BC835DRAFT_60146 [Cytidiella melzeri]
MKQRPPSLPLTIHSCPLVSIISVCAMTDTVHASANFRLAAMDLAHRLSSLQHYVLAAKELICRSEQLQPRDVSRHARKIVALIEISRQTLVRFNLRLYHFASCPPALAQHKAAFFEMLRTLKKQRCLMDDSDHELRGRIDRLLLPLSSNLRIASADITTVLTSSREDNVDLVSPPHSPACPASKARSSPAGTYTVPRGHSYSDAHGKMLPPDVLISRSCTRRERQLHLHDHISAANRAQHARRLNAPDTNDSSSTACAREDEPVPVALPQPRRQFGIFCASGSRPGHRRSKSVW